MILRATLSFATMSITDLVEVDTVKPTERKDDQAWIYMETTNPVKTKAIYAVGRPLLDVFDEAKNRKLDYRSQEAKEIIG